MTQYVHTGLRRDVTLGLAGDVVEVGLFQVYIRQQDNTKVKL